MESLIRLEMLGQLEVRQGNREFHRFPTQKTASLLAYLAYYKQRSHPREVLVELFWPEDAREAARNSLSVALNALRRQLEAPGIPPETLLLSDRSSVRLNPDACSTDVEDFDQILYDVEHEPQSEQHLALLMSALNLYQGDLLPGFYADWIFAERDRLHDAHLSVLRRVVKIYAEVGQVERAMEYAHRLVQADPLREASYHHLIRLYLFLGRSDEALHQYEVMERLLQKELQTRPSAPLREIAERLRQAAPSRRSSLDVQTSSSLLRDTGPNSLPPTFRLPLQFSRFFGREEEITQLMEALGVRRQALGEPFQHPTPNAQRLITLTGPGGIGKTRLAVEVAERVKAAFAGGLWFVALAELQDPLRIGEALRDALELPRQLHPPALEQVIAYLNGREQPTLLLLDNFEQITAGGAPVVWTLLNRVTSLRCLVTSRQPLVLPGEQVLPVSPLPIPTLQPSGPAQSLLPMNLLTYSSVALFVDRAQKARPEFQITQRNVGAIAALCEKLEGIPLAIELAAARAKALTPSQIWERLSERFELLASRRTDKGERHRSLWAAIEWSYHLLAPGTQRFFERLSVFRGGWSLEAAEAVCEEPEALEYLEQLRGHSLLQSEERTTAMRFGMLETIREFAAEQMHPEERMELNRRHAAYFHQWVTGAKTVGSEHPLWLDRFEEDLDNLRALLEWSLREEGEVEIGLQTAGCLSGFWQERGHLSEGRQWYARLLERAGETPTQGLGQSLYGAGLLAERQGDFQAASPLLERCLEVAQTLGDQACLASAYNEMGMIAMRQGDYAQARTLYEQVLALVRAQGLKDREAGALGNLANVAFSSGEFADSRRLNAESLGLWRQLGDRLGEARTLFNLGNLAFSDKQLEEAHTYYEQSLEIKRALNDRYGIVSSLVGLATVAWQEEKGGAAVTYAYASEAVELARELNARTILVFLLRLMTVIVRSTGELEMAAQMYAAHDRAREEMNYPLMPHVRQEYEQVLADLQSALGATAYDAARAEGSKLTLEQALACVEETLANKSL